MKDLFSAQADLYSKFRPTYPSELYEYILRFVLQRTVALDCATGNGQVARSLALHFKRVCAIDISERQIGHAVKLENVYYSISPAEHTPFPDNSFDRVIATYVISAVPDPVKTLLEMRRVCKPSGHLVILNHFKSDNPVIGMFEKLLAPVCTKIGFDTELKLMPLLERVALAPEQLHRVNLMNGWRLVRCINP